jgi:hypothetical protein
MTMPNTAALPPSAVPPGAVPPDVLPPAAFRRAAPSPIDRSDVPTLRVVAWVDPVADPHGLHPCSRYVELYWLPVVGPSTTWLLRRLSYGLEVHGDGFDLDLVETARSLGLGDRMGKNSPFRKAIVRLSTFELARPHGQDGLAVRTVVPPLPLRHLTRLPQHLQVSHRRWASEQMLPEPEQMRRRALRLATSLASGGRTREEIERQLGSWHFHPAVAYGASVRATSGGRGLAPLWSGPGTATV